MTSASLLGNKFDDEAVSLLLKVKEEKPQLITLCGLKSDQTEANFELGGLGPADAKLLAPEIAVHGSMTSASLLGNMFDDEAISLLLKVKEDTPQLITLCGLKPDQTEAYFSHEGLGPADAKLLAPEIAVHGSVTEVSQPL